MTYERFNELKMQAMATMNPSVTHSYHLYGEFAKNVLLAPYHNYRYQITGGGFLLWPHRFSGGAFRFNMP